MTNDRDKNLEMKIQHYCKVGFYEQANDYKDLKICFNALLSYFKPGEWEARRRKILKEIAKKDLYDFDRFSILEKHTDKICLYLVLAELAINDPMCGDSSQAAKSLPVMFGIGRIWHRKESVLNFDKKIVEIIGNYRKEPDGLLFEVLVALNYADLGWQVEMLLVAPNEKTPDLHVQSGDSKFFVECKRQSRQSAYSNAEGVAFEKMWQRAQNEITVKNLQDFWLDIVFHEELHKLPEDFLNNVIINNHFLDRDSVVIVNDELATIKYRRNNYSTINQYMSSNKLKNERSILRHLIGQDWAGLNSRGALVISAEYSNLCWCEAGTSSAYIDSISSAFGSTFQCDCPASIDAKARDVKKLLVDAVKQMPADKKSLIHIMIENSEGFKIDSLRSKKINDMFTAFEPGKMIEMVLLNSLRCNDVTQLVIDVDETFQSWVVPKIPVSNLPELMILPPNTQKFHNQHWNMRRL